VSIGAACFARAALSGIALVAITVLATSAGAQRTDRARADSAAAADSTRRRSDAGSRRAARLAPVEVHASIAPSAEPAIGSGVPARITVVTGRQIDAWEPRLLADALGTRAGVSLYDDLGTPWKLNLSTRGFTAGPTVGLPSGVTVFLDGVRQNEPDAQEVNFDLLPLEHVERVELLSGSASLLGPNSLGGAINLVTERGDGPPSGSLELSAGSFGTVGTDATFGGRAANGVDYYVGGSWERERGWRERTGARSYDGFVNVGRIGVRRGITLQGYAASSRAQSAGSLPESVFDVAPRANFTPGDVDDLDVEQLSLSGFAPLGAVRGRLTTYVRRSHAERFNVNQAPDPDVRSLTGNLTIGLTADARRSVALGAGTLSLRAGSDVAANRVRVRIYAEPTAAADEDEPTGLTTDARSPSTDLAGYALADYRLGRATLSGGARYDLVRVPFENAARPADRTTSVYRSLSPRVGASIAVAHDAAVYASLGRSFRAPAILELGCADAGARCPLPFALGDDPPLAPVHAVTFELGGHVTRGSLLVAASAYRTAVRDEIFFVAAEGALVSGYFTNLDRARREGLELSVEGSGAGGRLAWYANYAYTRATFQSGASLFSIRADERFAGNPLAGADDVRPGDRLPLVPDHQVKAGGQYELAHGVQLGLDARYTGEQWLRGDEANVTAPLAPHTELDARIAVTRGAWGVSAIVTNLFDSRRATFGTFNENRRTGALERFLTPVGARAA
jgi:outer membrane receptor protein involved in Fe transport